MSERLEEELPEALDGQRVDRVVAMLSGVSRTEAADLVRDGQVTVDGQVATRGADRLAAGVVVTIEVPDRVDDRPVPDSDVVVPVVYEDEHVIVVDKPAGLVVHPGAGHNTGTLAAGLLARYPEMASVGEPVRPGIVHRLDRGTSGLLVVARTEEARASLVDQLSARTVERRYRTLVWGHPDSVKGLIDAPLGRSPRHPTKMAVLTGGKEARTRYETHRRFTDPVEVSELTCSLETGRTHQIRVHLTAIGHPVVGDERYNGVRQSLVLARPFLHAEHLAFEHPISGERIEFDSPLPSDLADLLATLS